MKKTVKMPFNYSKLRGRMAEKSITASALAEELGLSDVSVSYKMNNKVYWSQEDIAKASSVLDIPVDQIGLYFFTI